MSEYDVMEAMREAGFDRQQIYALTYMSWKDGIGIQRPDPAMMRFAEIIRDEAIAECR